MLDGNARLNLSASSVAWARSSGELFGSREFFAGNDLARATGAFLGILGNSAEEYLGVGYQADVNGQPFHGSRRYRITFPPGGLPPVDAFWSVTVYDADRLLYANEINRYVIRSRDVAGMGRDSDGGLTIDVQHDRAALSGWRTGCRARPGPSTSRSAPTCRERRSAPARGQPRLYCPTDR